MTVGICPSSGRARRAAPAPHLCKAESRISEGCKSREDRNLQECGGLVAEATFKPPPP